MLRKNIKANKGAKDLSKILEAKSFGHSVGLLCTLKGDYTTNDFLNAKKVLKRSNIQVRMVKRSMLKICIDKNIDVKQMQRGSMFAVYSTQPLPENGTSVSILDAVNQHLKVLEFAQCFIGNYSCSKELSVFISRAPCVSFFRAAILLNLKFKIIKSLLFGISGNILVFIALLKFISQKK